MLNPLFRRTIGIISLGLIALALPLAQAHATLILSEDFDSGIIPGNWVLINHSAPAANHKWGTGNTGVFQAQDGPGGGYAAVDFNSVKDTANVQGRY